MSGLTDKEVAAQLGLSLDTVKTYWKRIRQKVGAQSRPEIIAILLEKGAQELLDENRTQIQRLTTAVASHRESEEQFRAIADSMPVGVYVTDVDDQGVFANRAWLQLTNLSRDEALHRGWSAPIHPLDKRRAIDAWNWAKKNSSVYVDQVRYRCPYDEEVGWLSLRATEIRSEGRLTGFVRTVVDVTSEREERERLLEVSKESFDLMFIAKVDLFDRGEEKILRLDYLDEGAARYFGSDPEDLICKDLRESVQGEGWREFGSLVFEVLNTGAFIEREIESPVPSSGGRVLFRIVPLSDGVVVAGRFVERVGS